MKELEREIAALRSLGRYERIPNRLQSHQRAAKYVYTWSPEFRHEEYCITEGQLVARTYQAAQKAALTQANKLGKAKIAGVFFLLVEKTFEIYWFEDDNYGELWLPNPKTVIPVFKAFGPMNRGEG